jgi:hypothetical protein
MSVPDGISLLFQLARAERKRPSLKPASIFSELRRAGTTAGDTAAAPGRAAFPHGPQIARSFYGKAQSLPRLLALQGHRLLVHGRQKDRPCVRAEALAKRMGSEAAGHVRSALPSQIESLFTRHPALCGFSVRGAQDVPDNCPRVGESASELFVGDIGVCPALPEAQFDEIFDDIIAAVTAVLAEGPAAGDRLRGRTFARVLH